MSFGPCSSERLTERRIHNLDALVELRLRDGQRRREADRFRRFGVTDLPAWLERLRTFQLGNSVRNIRCPSLALVGEGEGPIAMELFESFSRGVNGPVTKHVFTTAEGADTHCQLGNLPLSNAVVYDWLDEVLA